MTTRLGAVADRVAGQAFGLTNYDQLEADVNYLVVAGADQASGATVQVQAEFFGVTGSTTITNLNDPDGAAEGQQVRLWIKGGPLTIQNNGGGAGNIRTASGADTIYPTNAVATFVYTGALWQEQRARAAGEQLDYAQITTSVTVAGNSESTATVLITGNSVTYDGAKVKLEASFPGANMGAGGGTIVGVFTRDGTPIGQADLYGGGAATDLTALAVLLDTPTAGAHTYGFKAFNAVVATQGVKAGAGGSGALVPAFLRVTKA